MSICPSCVIVVLDTAIREAIASKEATTPDLGGSATSRMFTNAVLKRLR